MKSHAGDSPRILVPSYNLLVPSVDRLDPGLTINGLTVMPTLRYRGVDATPTTWPAWGYGETLTITAGTNAPRLGTGSPLLGTEDGVTFAGAGGATNTGKVYVAATSAFADITTEDCILELIIKKSSVNIIYVLGKSTSTNSRRWFVYSDSVNFYVGITDGVNYCQPISAPAIAGGWSHLLCVFDRSGSGIIYTNGVGGAAVVASSVGSLSNARKLALGGIDSLDYTGTPSIAYVAMWMGASWLDTHLQPTIAANRYSLLTASKPYYSFTGISSPAAKGSTSTTYQTLTPPPTRWLNPPAAATTSFRWKMQEASGNLTDDLSGATAVLTKNGTPAYQQATTIPMADGTNRYGIYTADGDTSYFQAALAATGDQTTNSFSVSFWLYTPSSVGAGGTGIIIDKWRWALGWSVGMTAALAVSIGVYDAGGTAAGSVTGTLTAGWHFITINYDRSANAYAFMDGVSVGLNVAISARNLTLTNVNAITFLRFASAATYDLNGAALAELIISNGLTTLAEHQAAYRASQYLMAPGTPRFNQVVDLAGKTLRGALVEAAGENKCLQSDDLATTWTQVALTSISANGALASDGLATLDGLVGTAADSTHYVSQAITLTAANWVISCECRAGNKDWIALNDASIAGGGVYFRISTATWGTVGAGVGDKGVINYGGGLIRPWIRVLGTSAAHTIAFMSANADNDADFPGDAATVNTWIGAIQVELGNYPSSRNPTTTTALTRAADSTYYTLAAGSLSDSEGALYLRFLAPVFTPGRSHYLAYLSVGATVTNSVSVFIDTNGRMNVATASTAGGSDAGSVLESAGTRCDGYIHEVLVTWTHNLLSLKVDNVLIGTDTACDPPAGLTRLTLGSDPTPANHAGPILVSDVQAFASSTNYRIVR
jgi:hypothetical protein